MSVNQGRLVGGVSKEELKYERLRALMSIDDRADVKPKELAGSWVP
jgi:hypothetical protein